MKQFVKLVFLALPLVAAVPSNAVAAETITGQLNGHSCAHGGHTCPVDRLDPHIALEPDFVLQKGPGDYYFLANVPRTTKARYVLDEVQVTGTVNEKYRSIRVDEFRVKKGDGFRTVWSQKARDEEMEYLRGDVWFPNWQQLN